MVAAAGWLGAQSNADPADAQPAIHVSVLRVPSAVMPGDPLRVSVESAAPLAELTLTLVLGDGTRVTGRAFTVDAEPLGTRWAAVMGIPSTAPATMAQLLISGRPAGDGEPEEVRLLLSQPLRIVPRAFMAEDIPLSAELSALRRTTDPRREEESRDLWRLLTTWRPVAHPHLGPLRLPLGDVRRTSGFGDRRRYLYDDGSIDNAIHHGVDFASPAGTAVATAGAGTVVMARPRIVTGLTVVIEHLPGVYSLYYHLARLAVQEGQRVSAGDPLGTVGSTGLATGPHLHWEVRAAGVPVDPDAVVAGPLVDLPGGVMRQFSEKAGGRAATNDASSAKQPFRASITDRTAGQRRVAVR